MEITVTDLPVLEQSTKNDTLLRLYRYWCEKRGECPLPSRDDIDPLEFSFALSSVSLIDVEHEPQRFHYRLVSTKLTERLGYEMTGKYADEIPEDRVRRYVTDLYSRAVKLSAPLFEQSTRVYKNSLWNHEALVLPLSSDAQVVDMLMICRTTDNPNPLAALSQDLRSSMCNHISN